MLTDERHDISPGNQMTQAKRNIRALIVLVMLLAAVIVAYWSGGTSNSMAIDKAIFRVDDLKSIDKVVLESKSGKVTLAYEGNRWRVNEKYPADRRMVDLLFATLQQAEPKRPVASVLKDSVSAALEENGVKVSLYAGNAIVKIFFAGGNKQKTQAYFKKQNDALPYTMVIPGYRVYASGVFELDENEWRDKRVFNFNWRNFKNLKTTFPSDPKQNFEVAFMDQYFGVTGLPSIDTMKLNNYLDAVSLLQVDRYATSGNLAGKYDSLLKTPPFLVIVVKDVSDKEIRLSLYTAHGRDQDIPGRIGDDQVVFFRKQQLAQVIKAKDYFRMK